MDNVSFTSPMHASGSNEPLPACPAFGPDVTATDSSAAAQQDAASFSSCLTHSGVSAAKPGTSASSGGLVPVAHADAERTAAEESGPTFHTAEEVARLAPSEVTWVAKPFIAEGALTVLDGKPKSAGKTTFLSHVVRKVLGGEPFLDEPTKRTPVVLLTEERAVTFRRVLERAGLTESCDFHLLFRDEVHGQPWSDVAKAARARCDETRAKLLIVDTLGAFAVGFERSPESMRTALAPLYDAARSGLAVLAVRHERKSGGTVGESGMGSTAMTAGVDIVLALQRPKNYSGSGRVLYARSRFDETPEETAIELHEGEFVRMPSLEIAAEEVERALSAAAPADLGQAKTADELMFATSLRKTTARDALARLCANGKLERVGSGTKGRPFRYHRPPLELAA
jgi:hypothetical protein